MLYLKIVPVSGDTWLGTGVTKHHNCEVKDTCSAQSFAGSFCTDFAGMFLFPFKSNYFYYKNLLCTQATNPRWVIFPVPPWDWCPCGPAIVAFSQRTWSAPPHTLVHLYCLQTLVIRHRCVWNTVLILPTSFFCRWVSMLPCPYSLVRWSFQKFSMYTCLCSNIKRLLSIFL